MHFALTVFCFRSALKKGNKANKTQANDYNRKSHGNLAPAFVVIIESIAFDFSREHHVFISDIIHRVIQ